MNATSSRSAAKKDLHSPRRATWGSHRHQASASPVAHQLETTKAEVENLCDELESALKRLMR